LIYSSKSVKTEARDVTKSDGATMARKSIQASKQTNVYSSDEYDSYEEEVAKEYAAKASARDEKRKLKEEQGEQRADNRNSTTLAGEEMHPEHEKSKNNALAREDRELSLSSCLDSSPEPTAAGPSINDAQTTGSNVGQELLAGNGAHAGFPSAADLPPNVEELRRAWWLEALRIVPGSRAPPPEYTLNMGHLTWDECLLTYYRIKLKPLGRFAGELS